MNELSVRLSDLQNAATQFNRSHQTISGSIASVNMIISNLIASGIDPGTLNETLSAPNIAQMQLAADRLLTLATRLNATVTDIEFALSESGRLLPHFDLSLIPERETIIENSEIPITLSSVGLTYVSNVNQPLHSNLTDIESRINEQAVYRETLVSHRAELLSELDAARNNVLSHDPTIDLSSVARIRALEAQVADLDTQIAEAEQTIADLQFSSNEIQARLITVQPATGADYSLIAQLEDSTSSPNVVNNTYDCVNHVVQKLAIPPQLARDAHLWNDLVLEHPEYGITIGDRPLAGAVIVLEPEHAYADDVYGHVLYVESVENGEIWVTDNLNPTPVKFSDLSDDLYGESVSYLYFPWHTKA